MFRVANLFWFREIRVLVCYLPTLALNSQVSYSLGLVASVTKSSFKCAYFVSEYFRSLPEASPLAGQIVDKETTTNEREITSTNSRWKPRTLVF